MAARKLRRGSPKAGRARFALLAALVFALLVVAAGTTSAAVGKVKEFAIPAGGYPDSITPGLDGNLWFAEEEGGQIGRITPSGAIDEFSVPSDGADVSYITTGADGALWFTEGVTGNIGRMTTSGVVTNEFPVPDGDLNGIAPGPDGNIWFTEFGQGKIGRITPGGVLTEFPTPSTPYPAGITAGPDGNLWFTEPFVSKVARITTSGTITEFSNPSGGEPGPISAGPDGALWFTEQNPDDIGRITTSGTITELPTGIAGSQPGNIVTGLDGNLWFSDGNNTIGRITTTGAVSEFPIPTADSYPIGVTPGPERSIWFTEADAGKIGQVTDVVPSKANVLSLAGGFAPATRTVAQGTKVQWGFYGPTAQKVVDNSGLGLFGSGTMKPVSFYTFQFKSAGTYLYADALNPTHTGSVAVPVKTSPSTGTTSTTFTITWSSAAPPAGDVFDVQILGPTFAGFQDWQVGVTSRSMSFVPDAGAGPYWFRARVRNPNTGQASHWSPTAEIVVS